MGEMENLAEFYYEKLKTSTNPVIEIGHIFKTAIGRDGTRGDFMMLNRLIKMFGRFTVFFSVMDLSKIERLEGNLFPLLYTICSNRFEKSHGAEASPALQSLDKMVEKIEKDREKLKASKIKIPSAEGLM